MGIGYFPVLKGKQGELRALRESTFAPSVSPVLEVIPWEREEASSIEDEGEIAKSAERIEKAWLSRDDPIFIDCSMAELDVVNGDWLEAGASPVLAELVAKLNHRGLKAYPVVRAAAIALNGYLEAVRRVLDVRDVHLDRLLIRVTAEDLDETTAPLRDVTKSIAMKLGLLPSRVDLLLDFGPVADDSYLSMSTRLAKFVLPQFQDQGWRSMAVGGGSFPADLSKVTPGVIALLPRLETRLWQSLSDYMSFGLGFSDYAVTHPVLPQGSPFAAPPQLRYLEGPEWLVAKGRRNDRRGHAQFYDICAQVLDSVRPSEPREESWGDRQVLLAAESAHLAQPSVGPGNASTWRAISTSRHLAEVAGRLREEASP